MDDAGLHNTRDRSSANHTVKPLLPLRNPPTQKVTDYRKPLPKRSQPTPQKFPQLVVVGAICMLNSKANQIAWTTWLEQLLLAIHHPLLLGALLLASSLPLGYKSAGSIYVYAPGLNFSHIVNRGAKKGSGPFIPGKAGGKTKMDGGESF